MTPEHDNRRPARDTPLDVVHVITTLTTGGAERQLELLMGRTRQRTAAVALYEGGPVADAMRRAGRRVEVLGMDGWRKPLAPLRLALLLRRYRPDVVHVHLLAAQLWAIPAARLARVPIIVSTEHSLMERTIEGRPHTQWLRATYRALERLATHTVAVSQTTAVRLQRWGVPHARVTVIDNGIDFEALAYRPEARRRVREELGIDAATVVLGAVGRLDPVKRMDQLLRAAAPLLSGGGRVLLMVGAGPLRGELERLAGELGVAGSVRWLGPRDDVASLLSAMDVLVSASQDETFGMAVVEAVGSGLPVVFVQCPALEELPHLPSGALRVDAVSDPHAQVRLLGAALRSQVERALRRHEVPRELVRRYGVATAARRVDELYAVLRQAGRR